MTAQNPGAATWEHVSWCLNATLQEHKYLAAFKYAVVRAGNEIGFVLT